MSTEVAERAASVPSLRPTPALQLDAEDLQISRFYAAQFMSKPVQDGLVKPGSLFVSTGQDDPEPVEPWKLGSKDQGVLVHVLSLRKGKSVVIDGELQLFDYDSPDAPADAWVTYNYMIALPEVDEDLPYKWLLSRSSKPAAAKINTVLAKNAISGPAWNTAFRIT